MTWLVVALFVLDAALIGAAVAQSNAVLEHLRTHHEETWRSLGSPAVHGGLLARSQYTRRETRYQRFLREGAYRALDDATFTAMVERGRVLDRWAWRATLVMLGAVVLLQLQQRQREVRDIRDMPPPPAPSGP